MADPIDRQELRKAMYHEAFETDSDDQMWDSGCWIRYKMFERILGSMPSAEPERKSGKWEMGRCSVCGGHAPFWCMATTYYESNYCPMCGADMRTPTQVQLDEADDVIMGGDNGKTD